MSGRRWARRRAERVEGGDEQARGIKGLRYILLKHPDKLAPAEDQRLSELRAWNRRLARAYELKEFLAEILDLPDHKLAETLLHHWLSWASRSRLAPFVKLARTIRTHRAGILAYVRTLLTNGLVEGFNARFRMIARRAFGFHSPKPLISMMFLCCGGIELNPPLPTRT